MVQEDVHIRLDELHHMWSHEGVDDVGECLGYASMRSIRSVRAGVCEYEESEGMRA